MEGMRMMKVWVGKPLETMAVAKLVKTHFNVV
jgi:hypothetical protein